MKDVEKETEVFLVKKFQVWKKKLDLTGFKIDLESICLSFRAIIETLHSSKLIESIHSILWCSLLG